MSYDVDTVHGEILGNISDTYQKTVGFPTYDLTRAFALAIKSLGDDLLTAEAAADVDNMAGDALTKWCYQRKGVIRKAATYAAGTVEIVTGTGTIAKGALFESAGGIQFAATEEKSVTDGDAVAVQAAVAGVSGNVAAGSIAKMPVTLTGISVVTNDEAMTGGYNAETDDSLRARYYVAVLTPATSANKNQYVAWAESVSGVGGAKCYPLENGANTVEVCIIDSDHQPASAELVAAVQEYIDPGSTGIGEGAAPIGAYCTVTSAAGIAINVACTVTLASGYDSAEVLANVTAGIKAYLAGIAFSATYVSYAKIANAINDAAGVLDYTGLTINGGTENITVPDKSVAIVGTVSIA